MVVVVIDVSVAFESAMIALAKLLAYSAIISILVAAMLISMIEGDEPRGAPSTPFQ